MRGSGGGPAFLAGARWAFAAAVLSACLAGPSAAQQGPGDARAREFLALVGRLNKDAGYVVAPDTWAAVVGRLREVRFQEPRSIGVPSFVPRLAGAYLYGGVLIVPRTNLLGAIAAFHEMTHARQDLLEGRAPLPRSFRRFEDWYERLMELETEAYHEELALLLRLWDAGKLKRVKVTIHVEAPGFEPFDFEKEKYRLADVPDMEAGAPLDDAVEEAIALWGREKAARPKTASLARFIAGRRRAAEAWAREGNELRHYRLFWELNRH